MTDSARGSRDRAQIDGKESFILPTLLVVGAITVLVFKEVMRAPETLPAPDTETVCNGVFGCGAPSPEQLAALAGPLLLVGIAWMIISPVRRVDDE
jgi:hypothetical protein